MLETRGGRNFGLDVLRCVAIAVVLANHAFLGFFVAYAGVPWAGRKAAVSIAALVSVEWLFVLSGFLIGTMMIRSFERAGTGWARAKSFWLRRWFRTMPNYYLFLGINVALAWAAVGTEAGFQWRYLAFAQNLAWPERWPFFFNEAWSLALDEWFYLVMPLLVLGVAAVAPKGTATRATFLAATALLILAPMLARALADVPNGLVDWDHRVRRVTIMHLDATGWGVLAAVASRWWPGAWSRDAGAKALLGLLVMGTGLLMVEQMWFGGLFARSPWASSTFSLTLIGLGSFLALPAVAALRPAGARVRRAVEAVSNWTYSIYLSHFPLLYIVCRALGEPLTVQKAWIGLGLWIPLTVAVSAAVYRWFEKPVLELRERFTERVSAVPFSTPAGASAPGTAPAPEERRDGPQASP